MGSFGTIPLADVLEMLKQCALGHHVREKPHHYWVTYNGQTFTGLPKGGHGQSKPRIEIGHIKKMIRSLEVDMECAKKMLPILR